MHWLRSLLALCTALSSASAGGPSPRHISIDAAPAPWQKLQGPLSAAAPLQLRIALSLPETTLHSLALNLSDPSHPSYGAHLSQVALSDILAPSTAAVNRISSWLEYSGAENISLSSHGASGGGWVEFHTTVGAADKFLSANFELFRYLPDDGAEGKSIVRSLSYTVPAEVAELVDFIHPIAHFPRKPARQQQKQKQKQQALETSKSDPSPQPSKRTGRGTATNPLLPRAAIPASCVATMMPACLTTLYNINYAAPANESSPSRIGVAGFSGEYPNHEFVQGFLESYGLPANRTLVDFDVEWINFSNASSIPDIDNSTTGGAEATIDLEYVMAYTNPLSVTYFYTDGQGPYLDEDGNLEVLPPSVVDNEPYLEFLEYFLTLADPPQVLSISYSDTEQTVPYEYASRVCTLFAAVAGRGVSVLVAAGDGAVEGTGGVPNDICVSNDGKNTTEFHPTFPSSCPYVTSVGATNLYPEIAASYSSGGFSNYFGVPDWQVNATSAYIASLNGTYDGLYNKSGRGIPDISAAGDRFLASFYEGGTARLSGTSASTPVVASMIALLNDERLRNGKSSLGWLNPALYSLELAAAWTDVIVGFNYGCLTVGFPAGPGWDAISGLGSPKFDVLRDLVV